jgi:hypothetical protein
MAETYFCFCKPDICVVAGGQEGCKIPSKAVSVAVGVLLDTTDMLSVKCLSYRNTEITRNAVWHYSQHRATRENKTLTGFHPLNLAKIMKFMFHGQLL